MRLKVLLPFLFLQLLKQQRVKLMKQMKEDVSNFQKWKKEKEKQVTQLQLKVSCQQIDSLLTVRPNYITYQNFSSW